MMRATRKPSRTTVSVVLLAPAWTRALPGVARLVRRAARAAAGNRKRSLTIALADDKRVRALNARHAKKDKPTNVLSYPSDERGFLGDVVLARQTVWREARQQRKTPSAPVSLLLVPGPLHLLGHAHDTGYPDAQP